VDGFEVLDGLETAEPSLVLPEDWEGARICLRFSGGVGDVVVAIGGTAAALAAKQCHITAASLPHQMPLLRQMVGVDAACSSTALNDPANRLKYDVLLEFSQVFNRSRTLRPGSYYGHVTKRVGIPVSPGRFLFAGSVPPVPKLAVVHTGSSNPNRRWAEAKWRAVITGLSAHGYAVRCLGTKDEWGIHAPGDNIEKLSELSDDLLWQAEQCAAAELFVGTDSGFAHICGVLGVPGAVVFTNTEPADVIGEYPSLKAVHAYDRLGVRPTRSLRKDDPDAITCGAAIEPEDVFEVLRLSKPEVEPVAEQPITRPRILVPSGRGTAAIRTIERMCDVSYVGREAEFDAVVFVYNKGTRAVRTASPPRLLLASCTDPDQAMRALREILAAR